MDEIEKSLLSIAKDIASYEPEATRKGRPTGEALGGRMFEWIVNQALCKVIMIWCSRHSRLRVARVVVCESLESRYLDSACAIIDEDCRRAMIFRTTLPKHLNASHELCLKNPHIFQMDYDCDFYMVTIFLSWALMYQPQMWKGLTL